MTRYLLDSSFVIALLNELASGTGGPALAWLRRNPRASLWMGPITLAEVLESADDADSVGAYLSRFPWQGIHRGHAQRVAALQRRAPRRMGENDAWQAALAGAMGAVVLGHDTAFKRLGTLYEDFCAGWAISAALPCRLPDRPAGLDARLAAKRLNFLVPLLGMALATSMVTPGVCAA